MVFPRKLWVPVNFPPSYSVRTGSKCQMFITLATQRLANFLGRKRLKVSDGPDRAYLRIFEQHPETELANIAADPLVIPKLFLAKKLWPKNATELVPFDRKQRNNGWDVILFEHSCIFTWRSHILLYCVVYYTARWKTLSKFSMSLFLLSPLSI